MGPQQDAGHVGLPAALDLRMLGPLEAWREGQRLSLGGQRQRSVLACLLLDLGHNVPSDSIIDSVWGERPPSGVQTTLQTYVFHLREALEPPRGKGEAPTVLVTVPGGYRIESTAVTVDTARFEALLSAGRNSLRTDPAAASAQLAEGLALWRGELLSDLPSLDGVTTPVSARLGELRIVATELWAEAELALGHSDVLGALDGLVARYPLREHLAALRMLALYRAGRQADALAAYRQLRHTLDDELGIQPSAEVETLNQRILRQDPGLDLVAPPQQVEPPVEPPPEPPGAQPVITEGARPRLLRGLSRRGWAAVTAIVVVAVAALVGVSFLALPADVTPLPPNSVGPIDARGLRGDAAMLDSAPSDLMWAGGAVWAVMENADAVVKIDPHSRAVVQTVRGVGGSPQAVATSGDDLWVAGYDEKMLTRINVPTGVVVKKIPVGIEPTAVVADPEGVWVANSGDNTVQHVNPATEKVDLTIPVGDGPDALALDGSTLWVANGRADTVTPLDAHTGKRVGEDVAVGSGPSALAVTDTDVWVANEFGQSVSRMSRSTGKVKRIDVADGPSSLVVLGDQVWVSNSYSGSLSRIDIATNAVHDVPVGSAPRATIVVDGQIWAGSGAFANADHRGGTLVWTGPGDLDLDAFDPAGGAGPEYGNLSRLVYDGLVATRLSGGRAAFGLVPDLATTLPEPSDGGRTYVFSIRPDIHYSTGAVVRPSDFVRGLERTLHPHASAYLSFAAIIGAPSCSAPSLLPGTCDLRRGMDADDGTGLLTIHLSRPDPEILDKLAVMVHPTPEGTPVGALGSESLPGTGPYQVADVDHGSVTLTRNPYFRQWSSAAQPDGYPDVISYRVTASQEAAMADVLAGRAHGAWPSDELPPAVTSRPNFLHAYDLVDMQYIFLNRSQPPFDDVRVRQAFSYAIDRRRIAEIAGAQVGCQMVPPTFPGFSRYCPHQLGPPDGEYAGPDLAKARQLVADSGTTGARLTIHHGSWPQHESVARYAAAVLADLGYQVEIRPIPPGEAYKANPYFDSTQMVIPAGWLADYLKPGTFYDYVASCAEPNFSRYCNPTIDAKANQARTLARTDPTAALATWAEVDRLLVDDAAMVPTHTLVGKVVISPDVGNVVLRPGYGPILDQLWVK